MRGLLGNLRRGWRSLRQGNGAPVPFEVACSCGRSQRGLRTARHQVIRCEGCGESLFILPRSPLPPVSEEDGAPEGARRRSTWLLPLLAAGATLTAVIVVYGLLFSSLPQGTDPGSDPLSPKPPTINQFLNQGRGLLHEGRFRQALKVLQAARTRDESNIELNQMVREAEVLAQLLDKPLEDVIRQAQIVDRDEWQERFRDHVGRSVLFDDVIRRDFNGEHHLTIYEVNAGDEKVRVELNLKVFLSLKKELEQPRRLLFGARLASVVREQEKTWVVRFDPDSGVLMTDEQALAKCGLAPIDPGLREVLAEQARWLGLPARR